MSQDSSASPTGNIEPTVTDVKMYPKSDSDRPSSSLSSKSSSDGRDQALRTSAIPLPETNLRNRAGKSEESGQASTTVGAKTNAPQANQPVNVNSFDENQPPNPDLVLLLNAPTADASSNETQAAQKEHARLIANLNKEGLLTSTAPGTEGSNQRIIFIKGVQSAVRAEAQKERFEDWLRTLRQGACREDLESPRDFQHEPLAPAERARLVARLLENVLYANPQDVSALQNHKPYNCVGDYFPLHDRKFNERLLKQWSQVQFFIPDSQLSDIRDHFGDGVALYFEFLRFYFRALAFPAFLGLCTWLGGHYFSRLYSFGLALWSIVFVESWRIRERQLGVRWGTQGISKDTVDLRPGFKPEDIVTSPITGQKVPHSPWYKREGRMLAGAPALIVFALGLSVTICCIFSLEVIIGEVYDGPGKQFISLLPLVGYAGVVPQVVGLWHQIAKQLTEWENHPTRIGHERALTLKMFALNAIVSYGVLTLTAYVYLPFSSFVVPFLTQKLRSDTKIASGYTKSLRSPSDFAVNSHRLTNTLFALMTTTQAIGAFTEVALPYIQRKLSQEYQERVKSKSNTSQSTTNGKWLDQIREECSRPAMELFSEYAEMVIQFGHVVLFSTAWPLAPVAALVNNFFEIRGDAFKLCTTMRRPTPTRADSIGPWLDALSFLCYLGALTNASLIYLLRPYTPAAAAATSAVGQTVQEMMQAVGNATHIPTLPAGSDTTPYTVTRLSTARGDYSSVKQALLGALLCALASEHAFVLVRTVVRHLFERLLWQGSKEESYVRSLNWHLRRDYIKSRKGEVYDQEITRLAERRQRDLNDVQQGTADNLKLPSPAFWRAGRAQSNLDNKSD